MGNESSTPKPVTHEQIVSIINASNVKEKVHSEKTAKSVELIAYILLTVICVAALFLVFDSSSSTSESKIKGSLIGQ